METIKSIRPCSHIRLDFYQDGNYAVIFPKQYWSKDVFLFNAQDMLIKYTEEGMQGYRLYKNSQICLDFFRSHFEIFCRGNCNHPIYLKNLYDCNMELCVH